MSGTKLSRDLINEVKSRHLRGESFVEIFDAIKYRTINLSETEIHNCIRRNIRSNNNKKKSILNKNDEINIPEEKEFSIPDYSSTVDRLERASNLKEFESICIDPAIYLLKKYEMFDIIYNANNVPNINNPPFDFFGIKNKEPYLIELKGSLKNYNSPSESQKNRIKKLINSNESLRPALFQINFTTCRYRIFYDKQMNIFFNGKKTSLKNIENWINEKLLISNI